MVRSRARPKRGVAPARGARRRGRKLRSCDALRGLSAHVPVRRRESRSVQRLKAIHPIPYVVDAVPVGTHLVGAREVQAGVGAPCGGAMAGLHLAAARQDARSGLRRRGRRAMPQRGRAFVSVDNAPVRERLLVHRRHGYGTSTLIRTTAVGSQWRPQEELKLRQRAQACGQARATSPAPSSPPPGFAPVRRRAKSRRRAGCSTSYCGGPVRPAPRACPMRATLRGLARCS
jgi:hypothetical protein